MWQYNYDYLCHASHKYIDKTWKNGRWYYTYDEKSGGVRRRESSASKTNVVFKKDLDYMVIRGIIYMKWMELLSLVEPLPSPGTGRNGRI